MPVPFRDWKMEAKYKHYAFHEQNIVSYNSIENLEKTNMLVLQNQ
jgi:hypothetical protein